MTFKEFFEIEPIQKNSLIVFLFVFFVSFLQLYLFKNDFLLETDLVKIFLSFAVSICWVASEIPTYFLFIASRNDKYKAKGIDLNLILDRVIIGFGLSLIFWMVTITYIAFEFDFTLRVFIRTSLGWMILKTLFWFLKWIKYDFNNKKDKT
ncbi:membrane hypothetical protein [Flavobacterium psychrophilum]|uniref:hypothetical protein n=1 Tax=Flavobacterium psychrophilum TaxID=96345 RepID=UPI000B7C282A|nr:hypothetical protein [Flavobacterium psychrophilum]GEJ39517.1 hypothetical protein FPN184_contig00107-0002 [Flavobacterium psychrophilum]GEJ50436.1 hypothetical protein FPKKA176_contig00114-0001 [Flavobacterium psychrophilum]SNB04664.1 membrane hypothetical protein [Flavobacterium psychrophilum]